MANSSFLLAGTRKYTFFEFPVLSFIDFFSSLSIFSSFSSDILPVSIPSSDFLCSSKLLAAKFTCLSFYSSISMLMFSLFNTWISSGFMIFRDFLTTLASFSFIDTGTCSRKEDSRFTWGLLLSSEQSLLKSVRRLGSFLFITGELCKKYLSALLSSNLNLFPACAGWELLSLFICRRKKNQLLNQGSDLLGNDIERG